MRCDDDGRTSCCEAWQRLWTKFLLHNIVAMNVRVSRYICTYCLFHNSFFEIASMWMNWISSGWKVESLLSRDMQLQWVVPKHYQLKMRSSAGSACLLRNPDYIFSSFISLLHFEKKIYIGHCNIQVSWWQHKARCWPDFEQTLKTWTELAVQQNSATLSQSYKLYACSSDCCWELGYVEFVGTLV